MTRREQNTETAKFPRPSQVPRVYAFSRAKVYELLNSGDFKSVRMGATRLVSVASIDNYLARLAKEQTDTQQRAAHEAVAFGCRAVITL